MINMIIFSLTLGLCFMKTIFLLEFVCLLFLIEMALFLILYLTSWYHAMMLLMILELFMLKIYFFLVLFHESLSSSMSLVFLFMSASVAEASLGMALLTLLIRVYGDDFILL